MIGGIWRLIKDLFLMRKFELHLPDEYTRSENVNLGEQWIMVLDYKKCDCWAKYGPNNTCERCKGFGAVP